MGLTSNKEKKPVLALFIANTDQSRSVENFFMKSRIGVGVNRLCSTWQVTPISGRQCLNLEL